MIILTPYSRENPLKISSDEYEKLVHTNEKGWSHCDSKEEYLAKLHYLRDGYIRGMRGSPGPASCMQGEYGNTYTIYRVFLCFS